VTRPDNVGFTVDELRDLLDAVNACLPDEFTVKSQLTERSVTVTLRWTEKRPVLGPTGAAALASVLTQPQAPLQLASQLLDLMESQP
jgi:hypothetical protein